MNNLVRASLLGLRHSWAVRIGLAAPVLAAIAYGLLSHLIATGGLDPQTAAAAQGVSDIMVVTFLGSLLTGVAVSQDFETKAIHDAILAAPRAVIVAAKTLVVLLLVGALTLPYVVLTLVAGASGLEFATVLPTFVSDTLVRSSGAGLEPGELVRLAGIGLANIAWYAGQLSICIPFAFLVPKPAAVLGVGFGGGFVAQGLANVLAQSEVTENFARLLPWGYASPNLDTAGADVAATVAVGFGWVMAMAVLAWLVFRKRDVA